jgi:hypothetical protein
LLLKLYNCAFIDLINLIVFQVAVKTLPFYKDYFGISYPLPKMDLIAIADFAAGTVAYTVLYKQSYKNMHLYNIY